MRSGILLRFLLAFLLAAAALTLFLMQKKQGEPTPAVERDQSVASVEDVRSLDRDIDTVLSRFGIESAWVKKREISLPNSTIMRRERRVQIPLDVVPIQINLALNTVAKRYHGRAVASENSKENTLTIHVELGGTILQTIILKPNSQIRRQERQGVTAAT